MKLDSHLHVWADKGQAASFPFPGGEPPYPGNAELLLDSMKESDVHGALIVQPANHKFDHSYVSSVLARYPGKFVGCLLADPTENGGGVDELDRLITQEGYRAVRFNPYLWPEDQSMANEVGRAMFKRAGELGAPVGFMTFKGLLNHVKDIEELCEAYPRTTVMLDHFGFCKCSAPDSEEWAALLSLARFPQVYVKVSAFFRVSDEPYPYMDARPMIRRLIDGFGADRLLWGTDFPWITEQCGYAKAWRIVDDGDREESGNGLLSSEEKEKIFGGNLARLFPGGWY
uniref:Catalytic hydrolase n=1 Tax=Tetraselmis sp. GSL018 TaxID=582737 RepID=A0A061RAH3_9CHLO